MNRRVSNRALGLGQQELDNRLKQLVNAWTIQDSKTKLIPNICGFSASR
jgi:hypothetical protein